MHAQLAKRARPQAAHPKDWPQLVQLGQLSSLLATLKQPFEATANLASRQSRVGHSPASPKLCLARLSRSTRRKRHFRPSQCLSAGEKVGWREGRSVGACVHVKCLVCWPKRRSCIQLGFMRATGAPPRLALPLLLPLLPPVRARVRIPASNLVQSSRSGTLKAKLELECEFGEKIGPELEPKVEEAQSGAGRSSKFEVRSEWNKKRANVRQAARHSRWRVSNSCRCNNLSGPPRHLRRGSRASGASA